MEEPAVSHLPPGSPLLSVFSSDKSPSLPVLLLRSLPGSQVEHHISEPRMSPAPGLPPSEGCFTFFCASWVFAFMFSHPCKAENSLGPGAQSDLTPWAPQSKYRKDGSETDAQMPATLMGGWAGVNVQVNVGRWVNGDVCGCGMSG